MAAETLARSVLNQLSIDGGRLPRELVPAGTDPTSYWGFPATSDATDLHRLLAENGSVVSSHTRECALTSVLFYCRCPDCIGSLVRALREYLCERNGDPHSQSGTRRIGASDGAPIENASNDDDVPAPSLRRAGPIWFVGSTNGTEDPLTHRKGLSYLAVLLREPGRKNSAIDLVRLGSSAPRKDARPDHQILSDSAVDVSPVPNMPSDNRDILESASHIRAALRRIEDEIQMAEKTNDQAAIDRLAKERSDLRAWVRSNLGTGDRVRPNDSDLERARKSVSKEIRRAIEAIRELNSHLGTHLRHTIHTGSTCWYEPDADRGYFVAD